MDKLDWQFPLLGSVEWTRLPRQRVNDSQSDAEYGACRGGAASDGCSDAPAIWPHVESESSERQLFPKASKSSEKQRMRTFMANTGTRAYRDPWDGCMVASGDRKTDEPLRGQLVYLSEREAKTLR